MERHRHASVTGRPTSKIEPKVIAAVSAPPRIKEEASVTQNAEISGRGTSPAGSGILKVLQRLPTSGARTVAPFALDGSLYLAIPQLAEDVLGQTPHMNAGNSDIDTILYRWHDGGFHEAERLRVPGGEDAVFFRIGADLFLATASVRTGSGPYDLNVMSKIFRRQGGAWIPFQEIPTFAAKQWHYFSFDGRHFLALAQGVTVPGAEARHPRQSCIFEWNGTRFVAFQTLEGRWGYGWAFFELDGGRFLAYADHTSVSCLYRWNGERFAVFQNLSEQGGRAFVFFATDRSAWLAFANIAGESTLYRWDGSQFAPHQILGGPGGREFELIWTDKGLHLVRICFIQGTPAAPKTDLISQIYRWDRERFALIHEFATFGGTAAAAFEVDGERFLAVSNSLGRDIRFREDTVIYRLGL
jgi:EPTP domain